MHTPPKVHGHRGARGILPENSLPAIEHALNCGVDGVEVDLCVTKDNVVVLHHDLFLSPFIARKPTGEFVDQPIPIRSLTFRELTQFDIGQLNTKSDYGKKFSEQKPRPNTPVPTLQQFVEILTQHHNNEVIFNLELKGSPDRPSLIPSPEKYVQLVADVLRSHDCIHRCFVQSFDWKLVRLMGNQFAQLNTGLLTDAQEDGDPQFPAPGVSSQWTDGWVLNPNGQTIPDLVSDAGAAVWSSNYQDINPHLMERARSLGLEVYVWTVNEPTDMLRMIELGVDVITTDYPDRLLALIENES